MNPSQSVFQETVNWCKERNIFCAAFETTTSTNDIAKEEALAQTENIKLYVANQQTQGRGRNQHHWENAPQSCALLSSWSFRLEHSPMTLTAPLIGLALYNALCSTYPAQSELLSIKAPNDIYLADKKIAGLLIEVVSTPAHVRLIIGLGLNVLAAPHNVDIAGSLLKQSEWSSTTWHSFLDQLLRNWTAAIGHVHAHQLTEEQRTDLLQALNKNPLITDKFSNISPFGDLCTANRTISWRDL